MSPQAVCLASQAGGFPRVSGDEPWALLIEYGLPAFSPRERG